MLGDERGDVARGSHRQLFSGFLAILGYCRRITASVDKHIDINFGREQWTAHVDRTHLRKALCGRPFQWNVLQESGGWECHPAEKKACDECNSCPIRHGSSQGRRLLFRDRKSTRLNSS